MCLATARVVAGTGGAEGVGDSSGDSGVAGVVVVVVGVGGAGVGVGGASFAFCLGVVASSGFFYIDG